VERDFFAATQIEETVLSTGDRIGLPVRYYEWSWINALFPAPAAGVQRLLPTSRLKPLLITPGTAMISIAAMEYLRIADVAPYNEFAIGVPVQYEPAVNVPGISLLFHPLLSPQRFERFGVYIHRLPVTTQAAYDFGVEIWGYPKMVTEIVFEDEERARRCRLRAAGEDMVTLEVKKSSTEARELSWHTYTVKDGQLLRTLIQTEGQFGISRSFGGASYSLGSGPIADELAALGVGKTTLGRIYAPQIRSQLHPASERLQLS
jgi:hypothetical protein